MIETVEYSTVVCDNCGNRFGGFTGSPQLVARELVDKYGWTAFDELHHCGACPPICSSCGLNDLDCDCTHDEDCDCMPRSSDTAYVSREPNVIEKARYCEGCGQFRCICDEADRRGQG